MDNINTKEELKNKVKAMIIDRLEIEIEIEIEDINDNAPIFGVDENGEGLNLDSVDALELVVGMNEAFGVKHQSDDLSTLYSVNSITEYIQKRIGE